VERGAVGGGEDRQGGGGAWAGCEQCDMAAVVHH
jgi:hypothetical protein